jgi:hypothetical protein
MSTALVRYQPKPSFKERVKQKLALWAWMLGLKKFED